MTLSKLVVKMFYRKAHLLKLNKLIMFTIATQANIHQTAISITAHTIKVFNVLYYWGARADRGLCSRECHLPVYYICSVGTVQATEVNESILE